MRPLDTGERIVVDHYYIMGYKFIARNKGGTLYAYGGRPQKNESGWFYNDESYVYSRIFSDTEEFLDFIKWEDDEPYEIEKLLEGENNG